MCLTFHIYPLRRYFIENFEIFFGGYPHFGHLKGRRYQNEHPRTTYNPTFLLHYPTLLWKWRCLQKTRAQKVKIWPRYKGFKFGKIWTKIFEKIWLRTKKCRKSASFQDFVDFFCPMRSVNTPLVYIWVNIDTRGCIKSPEKPIDSCGHLVPPPRVITRIPIPGSDRVNKIFPNLNFSQQYLPEVLNRGL